jgi:exosortase/archaeosortase family protein
MLSLGYEELRKATGSVWLKGWAAFAAVRRFHNGGDTRAVLNDLGARGSQRPSPAPRRPAGRHRSVRSPLISASRIFAIGLLAAIAMSLMVFQYQFRHLEAAGAAHIYNVVTPTLAASSAPIIWFGLGTTGAFGLVITPDCSSALLIAPLCGLGMALMVPRRLPVRRVVKALSVAAAVMVAGNFLRIGVIALAIRTEGIGAGYQVGHLVLGSLISIVCIALGLALLTLILIRRDGERLFAVARWQRRTAQ